MSEKKIELDYTNPNIHFPPISKNYQELPTRHFTIPNPKYFKKSRSLSPKDHYKNIRKIPLSNLEAFQNISASKSHKAQYATNNILEDTINSINSLKLPDKTLSGINMKGWSKEDEEAFDISKFSDHLCLEDFQFHHPLYYDKFNHYMKTSKVPFLTQKQLNKENFIKLVHLNALLEKDLCIGNRSAIIIYKILEVLKRSPEFLPEFERSLLPILLEFLFCQDEKVWEDIRRLIIKKKIPRPQTFVHLVKELIDGFDEQNHIHRAFIRQNEERIKELENENNALKEELDTIVQRMKKKMEIALKERDGIEKGLTHKINNLTAENSKISKELSQQIQNTEVLKESYEHEIKTLRDNRENVKRKHQEQIKVFESEIEARDQKYHSLFNSISQTKENYHNSLIYLKTLKDKLKMTQKKLFDSEKENHRLNLRAAVNFSELTPRPDLIPLAAIISINSEEFVLKSTVEKTGILFERIKALSAGQLKRDSVLGLGSPLKKGQRKHQVNHNGIVSINNIGIGSNKSNMNSFSDIMSPINLENNK